MITVKRFWVFEYYTYYPSGGMRDHKHCFDTLEEAVASVKDADSVYNNVDIWDIQLMKCIWKNGEHKQ